MTLYEIFKWLLIWITAGLCITSTFLPPVLSYLHRNAYPRNYQRTVDAAFGGMLLWPVVLVLGLYVLIWEKRRL